MARTAKKPTSDKKPNLSVVSASGRRIEKNIPLPGGTGKGGALRKYHEVYEMDVGDSVFMEGKSTSDFASMRTQIARSHGKKIAIRKVEGGVRIWRIA
jgi:hypothetical protein